MMMLSIGYFVKLCIGMFFAVICSWLVTAFAYIRGETNVTIIMSIISIFASGLFVWMCFDTHRMHKTYKRLL